MWAQLRRLDEVCTVVMGQAPAGDSYNDRGDGLPLIAGAGDFGNGIPKPKKFTTSPGKLCAQGDIVLGIRASIGEKVVANAVYCLGRGVAGLRPRFGLSDRYLWHWLSTVRSELAAKGRGATFKQINREDLRELQIPVPPIEEQRRIADILDRADAVRDKRREALAHLGDLTQSIFLDMFGDPNVARTTLPVRTIGDMVTLASYGTSAKAGSEGRYPVLRMGNVTVEGRLDLSDLKYMDLDPKDEARYLIRRGDILFNRTNSADLVGKTAIYESDEPAAYAGYLVRLRVNADNRPQYLSAFLNSAYGKRVLRGMAKSIVGMANINAQEVKRIKLGVPSIEDQMAFAERIRLVERERDKHIASAAELDDLFASLQQRAFAGAL